MKRLILLLILSFSINACSQKMPEHFYSVERQDVTKDIFVMIRPFWTRIFVVGNISVISTKEGLIVFDGGNSNRVSKQAIEEIKKQTSLPVKYLIISHGHIDHTGGIEEFKNTWPEMEIIGHNTVFNYLKGYQVRVKQFAKNSRDAFENRDSLYTATITDQSASELKAYYKQYYYHDLEDIINEYESANIVLPTVSIEDSVNLYLGGQLFQVFKAGNGNTPSDLMLYDADDKVLFTGDVVTRPVPYGYTDFGEEWIKVLDKILQLDVEWVIPGHGDPLKGKEYVTHLRDMFKDVISQIKQGIAQGKSSEEIRAGIRVEKWRDYFAKGDPVINNRLDEWFLDPIVARTYRVLTSK